MAESAINIVNLTRKYGKVIALDNLSLNVPSGGIFGFLGPNGAGKTTTIRILLGLIDPTNGRVEVMGYDTMTQADQVRANTGVLLEHSGNYEDLSAEDNLEFFARINNMSVGERRARIKELLTRIGLWERRKEVVRKWSRGMKQKLALARALIHEPDLLFLDEPTAGLDPVITRQVHDLIREQSRSGDRTVFLCTHNLDEAQRLCDRVALLQNGRMIALGSPAELAKEIWPGVHLEIETGIDKVRSALGALQAFEGISEVNEADGNDLIVISLNNRERIPDLVAHLVANDVPIFSLTSQEPSLEDVYFALNADVGRKQ